MMPIVEETLSGVWMVLGWVVVRRVDLMRVLSWVPTWDMRCATYIVAKKITKSGNGFVTFEEGQSGIR